MATYRSELKCWLAFCEAVGAPALPASETTVLRFLTLFRNGRSAAKYVAALVFFHDWQRHPTKAWDTRALRQRLRGLTKETLVSVPLRKARPLMWPEVRRLIREARLLGRLDFALVCLFASVFLLRVPSECLPLCFDRLGEHSSLRLQTVGGRLELVLSLRSRKNLPQGSVLTRGCTCARDPVLCAPHGLMQWAQAKGRAWTGSLFSYPASSFRRDLQQAVASLRIPEPQAFSSQSFRRGTAQELCASGSPLAVILEAGQWRSNAFMQYLCRADIEGAALLDVILADSDSDAEGTTGQSRARRARK